MIEREQNKRRDNISFFFEWTSTQNVEYITSMCRRSDHQPDKRFRSSVSLTSSSTSPSAPPALPPSSPSGTPAQSPPGTEREQHGDKVTRVLLILQSSISKCPTKDWIFQFFRLWQDKTSPGELERMFFILYYQIPWKKKKTPMQMSVS